MSTELMTNNESIQSEFGLEPAVEYNPNSENITSESVTPVLESAAAAERRREEALQELEFKSQWQNAGEKTVEFVESLPTYISRFFSQYKPILTVIGWTLLAILSLKLLVALIDTVNDIPLVKPLLELVGFGYLAWFTYRYLLTASNRQELSQQINQVKSRVLGDRHLT